jgi:hypothetical protein
MPRMPNNKDGHVLNATLMIYNADTFTPEGRKVLATWLRQQAAHLVKHGAEYAPRYRARRWSISEGDPTPDNDGGEPAPTPPKSSQKPKSVASRGAQRR